MIWSTPQRVFDKLNEEFEFQIDVCADPDNAKCAEFYTRERGLQEEWTGMCFMNPPYGRGKLIDPWISKAHEVAFLGKCHRSFQWRNGRPGRF